jgi:IclR family acetate operon transcriptional repressor
VDREGLRERRRSLPPAAPGRYTIRVLDHALDVLELLRDARRPLGLAEISRRARVAKSSAFRLLSHLEHRGYVERADGGLEYRLGLLCATLGRQAPTRPLSELALPHMQRLMEQFGETVNLGILRDGEVSYIEILESPRSFRLAARVGARAPLHSTAIGKAIAAFLPADDVNRLIARHAFTALTPRTITSPVVWRRTLERARKRGYTEDREETEPGASCLAAPLLAGADGVAIGALSLSGPTSRIHAIAPRAVPALVRACAAISQGLGYRPMEAPA